MEHAAMVNFTYHDTLPSLHDKCERCAARLHRGLYTAALVSTNEPPYFWQNYHLQKKDLPGDSHCPPNTYIDFNFSHSTTVTSSL